MELLSFQALKKNLRKDFNAFKLIKLAILGDSATQMYVQAIKGYGYEVGLNFEIFEADYDQIERQIYDPTSVLYEFKPEYIIIFYCTNKLLKRFGKLSLSEKPDFGQDIKDKAENLYQTIINRLKCKVIYVNYPEINDAVFGNYGNKTNISFIYQVRRINFELMTLSQKLNSLYILDVNTLQSQYGQSFITD